MIEKATIKSISTAISIKLPNLCKNNSVSFDIIILWAVDMIDIAIKSIEGTVTAAILGLKKFRLVNINVTREITTRTAFIMIRKAKEWGALPSMMI